MLLIETDSRLGSVGLAQLKTRLHPIELIDPQDIGLFPAQMMVVADVNLYLQYGWSNPTIVLADAHQGAALAAAWQQGAVSGWVRSEIPDNPRELLYALESRHKTLQDCRDMPSAARLQQKLLPRKMDLPNFRIDQYFQAATHLSGDWLDYWLLDDNNLLFYLADVSGHGTTSSLLTTWLAAFHGMNTTPDELLKFMNKQLIQRNVGKHITVLAGMLTLDTAQVTLYSAGHYPPAIYLQPGDPPRILYSSSLSLGLTLDFVPVSHTVLLSPNSHLILCSDGALEMYQGGLTEQLEQLVNYLASDFFVPDVGLPDDLTLFSIGYLPE